MTIPSSAPSPARAFALKLQQYTGPLQAKGLEDTAFYRYPVLLSLNEVGGDPQRFGVTPRAFHAANQHRAAHWPLGMLATSTHDSKRGEDARCRIDVLSEIPSEWEWLVMRWRRNNASARSNVDSWCSSWPRPGCRISTRAARCGTSTLWIRTAAGPRAFPCCQNGCGSWSHHLDGRTSTEERRVFLAELLRAWPDGRIEHYLTCAGLRTRRRERSTFVQGGYVPLESEGELADHVVALARTAEQALVVALAPRLCATLASENRPPLGAEVRRDTLVRLPSGESGVGLVDVFTARACPVCHDSQGAASRSRMCWWICRWRCWCAEGRSLVFSGFGIDTRWSRAWSAFLAFRPGWG